MYSINVIGGINASIILLMLFDMCIYIYIYY